MFRGISTPRAAVLAYHLLAAEGDAPTAKGDQGRDRVAVARDRAHATARLHVPYLDASVEGAAGNAAIFLRLDDMKMLEIRNAPFDGGKAVWVPNAETGYMKAEVLGEGDKPNTTKVTFDY